MFTIDRVARETSVEWPTAKKYLTIMEENGLVKATSGPPWPAYILSCRPLEDLEASIEGLSSQWGALNYYVSKTLLEGMLLLVTYPLQTFQTWLCTTSPILGMKSAARFGGFEAWLGIYSYWKEETSGFTVYSPEGEAILNWIHNYAGKQITSDDQQLYHQLSRAGAFDFGSPPIG